MNGDGGFEEWGFLEVSRGGAIRPGFFVVASGAIDLRATHGERTVTSGPDGLVIGWKSFVEEVFVIFRDRFGIKRQSFADLPDRTARMASSDIDWTAVNALTDSDSKMPRKRPAAVFANSPNFGGRSA